MPAKKSAREKSLECQPKTPAGQTPKDREAILRKLPSGTRRILVLEGGSQKYKAPEDVDVWADEIPIGHGTKKPVTMRGRPGRRPTSTSALRPTTPQIAEVWEAREDHIELDLVVSTVTASPGDATLDVILRALAVEASNLEFERLDAQRKGRDASDIAVKRSRVLKTMADVTLKRKSLESGGAIDLDGPVFAALFGHLIETFRDALTKGGLRVEQVTQVLTHFAGLVSLPGWKQEALTRMKDKAR